MQERPYKFDSLQAAQSMLHPSLPTAGPPRCLTTPICHCGISKCLQKGCLLARPLLELRAYRGLLCPPLIILGPVCPARLPGLKHGHMHAGASPVMFDRDHGAASCALLHSSDPLELSCDDAAVTQHPSFVHCVQPGLHWPAHPAEEEAISTSAGPAGRCCANCASWARRLARSSACLSTSLQDGAASAVPGLALQAICALKLTAMCPCQEQPASIRTACKYDQLSACTGNGIARAHGNQVSIQLDDILYGAALLAHPGLMRMWL